MIEVVVIADDLTGAADTGIQFRALYAEALLMPGDGLVGWNPDPAPQVLALHTTSRSLPAEEARAAVGRVARRLARLRPARIFKKVDSALRGNLGAEADALLEALGLPLSFVAPAFPDVGRTTVHDIHLVHGQPVAESEMGRDPMTPVTESRLSQVVAAQSRHPVGHVDLETLEAGGAALVGRIDELAGRGIRHVVFDITEHRHLTAVAGLALEHFPAALLVGSAGLARGLCDCRPRPGADLRRDIHLAPGRHHLVALGTASERARRQVEVLQAAHPGALFEMDAAALAVGGGMAELARMAESLAAGDVVVRIAAPRSVTAPGVARRVAAGFGAAVAALVERMPPATLFLSGGDTALSVLDRLGVRGLRLEREIVPGLVVGTAAGGGFEGLVVGTKPGAFGDDDAILKWRDSWT